MKVGYLIALRGFNSSGTVAFCFGLHYWVFGVFSFFLFCGLGGGLKEY